MSYWIRNFFSKRLVDDGSIGGYFLGYKFRFSRDEGVTVRINVPKGIKPTRLGLAIVATSITFYVNAVLILIRGESAAPNGSVVSRPVLYGINIVTYLMVYSSIWDLVMLTVIGEIAVAVLFVLLSICVNKITTPSGYTPYIRPYRYIFYVEG